MSRRTKPLKEFHGYTHEDVYGVLQVLVAHRFQLGLSQQVIAERMGTSPSVLSRLEGAGDRESRPPTLQALQRYARALGVEVRLAVG